VDLAPVGILPHYENIQSSLADADPWWPFGTASAAVLVLSLLWLLVRVRARRNAAAALTERDAAPPQNREDLYALLYACEEHAAQLSAALAIRSVRVTSPDELATVIQGQGKPPTIAFVDLDLAQQVAAQLSGLPVVAIVDEQTNSTLPRIVNALDSLPSVGDLIAAPLLASPLAKPHLSAMVDRLIHGPESDLLGATGVGRVAMLAQASRRETRFERMREYFAKHDVPSRTTAALQDVAEELVMNALYNAPTEAGFFETPISRTEDVTLPLDRACEISYGMREGNAFVRLRDTFGALRRERLLEVLTRCMSTSGVGLDESRGGAGLGLWRVFSVATMISITVLPGQLTDILVQVAPKQGNRAKLLAVHLAFADSPVRDSDSLLLDHDSELVDHSITLLCATA
jgi:hypothetical protein